MTAKQERILQEVLRNGAVEVEELAEKLSVSPSTVRRRLTDLESRGLLRRTHGGAVSVEAGLYEPFRYDASFHQQETLHADAKRRIGLAAASLVQDGETIAISAGTTATQVARCLRHRASVTIVTNAVNIAMELSNCPGLTIITTGGVLSGGWFSLLGPIALRTVEEFFYDRVFVGLDGLHEQHGITYNHPDEAALNRAMARQAKQVVAVADASKIGRIASAQVCALSSVDLVLTDTGASDDQAVAFAERGVELRRV